MYLGFKLLKPLLVLDYGKINIKKYSQILG